MAGEGARMGAQRGERGMSDRDGAGARGVCVASIEVVSLICLTLVLEGM